MSQREIRWSPKQWFYISGGSAIVFVSLLVYAHRQQVSLRTREATNAAALVASAPGSESATGRPVRQRSSTWYTHPPTEMTPRNRELEDVVSTVRDGHAFRSFADRAKLGEELQTKVAQILARGRLNMDTAERTPDKRLRDLLPGRIEGDTRVQVLAKLSTDQRPMFEQAGLLAEVFSQERSVVR